MTSCDVMESASEESRPRGDSSLALRMTQGALTIRSTSKLRITRHVSSIYIGEEALMHPGGTNLYLAGDRDLALIDTGDAGTYARDKVVAALGPRKGAAL